MIVVLADPYTRAVSKFSYDIISKHSTIITDTSEVNEEMHGASFVFFEPSAGFHVTPDTLNVLVEEYEIKPIFAYAKEESKSIFDEAIKPVKVDYTNIDWTLIYALVNDDHAILESYGQCKKAIDATKVVLGEAPENIKRPIERLYSTACSLAVKCDKLTDDIAVLNENNGIQKSIIARSKVALDELTTLLDKSQMKCQTYEALLSQEYDKVFMGFYPDRPQVLYIKEVSHLAGTDILLSLLHTVLTKQYRASCKVVSLLDAGSSKTLRYLPRNYVRLTDTYNTSVVLTNDFVAKLGAYSELFDLLCTNRSGLDYLIVHDMRDTFHAAMDSSLIDLRINEMTADYAILAEYPNVLSSSGVTAQYTWDFAEISRYTGSNSIKLTGHPTVASILSDFRG